MRAGALSAATLALLLVAPLSSHAQAPAKAQGLEPKPDGCGKEYVLQQLVSVSEACCVKCASQTCSTNCADKFLPFHDACRGKPSYNALMPLGGGTLEDFETLAVRCKDPAVTAARHHAASKLGHAHASHHAHQHSINQLEQRMTKVEVSARSAHEAIGKGGGKGGGGGGGGDPAAVKAVAGDVAALRKRLDELAAWKSTQDQVQSKLAAMESQVSQSKQAAAAAEQSASALQDKVQRLESQLQGAQQEQGKLQGKLAGLEAQVQALQAKKAGPPDGAD